MDFPSYIYIDTDARCNLHCDGCWRTSKEACRGEYMNYEKFGGLLNEIEMYCERRNLPLPRISPQLQGEPLFDYGHARTIFHGLERYHHFPYFIVTNGTRNTEVLKDILKAGSVNCYEIVFSAHPEHPMDHLLYTIKQVCEWRDTYEANTTVGLSLVQGDYSYEDELAAIHEEQPDYTIMRRRMDSNRKTINHIPSTDDCRYLRGELLIVQANGDVRLCEHHLDAPVLGNVFRDGLIQFATRKQRPRRICKFCSVRSPPTGVCMEGQLDSGEYFHQDFFNTIYSKRPWANIQNERGDKNATT